MLRSAEIKKAVEQALQPIVGEPLTDMWRYAGCQKFEFGVQRPAKNDDGEEITLADWGLVVSCDWSVSGPAGRVVSSDDFGPGRRRRDKRAHPFYDSLRTEPPVVECIEADEEGALFIQMGRRILLTVRPDPKIGGIDEQWRFMPKDKAERHFVLCGDGIELE